MIWGIFLAVLAALALLGRTRLGFRGTYTRQEVGVWFRLGAFQWRLYPWKKGKKPEKPKEAKQQPRPSKPEVPKPPILSPSGVFQLGSRRSRLSTSRTDGSMWTWTLTGGSPPCMGRSPCPSPPASFCGWACGTAPGV